MSGQPAPRPLLCWEGLVLRLDLDELERWLGEEVLAGVDAVRDVRLEADGDALDVSAQVNAKGIAARVTVRLRELRLARRLFGCRVEWVRGPLGLPIPLPLLAPLLDRAPRGMLMLDEDRILLVNLGRAIPPGLELRVVNASARGRWLDLELGAGCMIAPEVGVHDEPRPQAPASEPAPPAPIGSASSPESPLAAPPPVEG